MGKRKKNRKLKQVEVNETKFLFQETDQIGAAGAEDDKEFLSACFIDTGYLGVLEDIEDNRIILIGRTGSGKSALINQLIERRSGQVIKISPQDLALKYLANSTILQFFNSLNINLDPFFKLLWRHVITVEVLSRHFDLHPELVQKKLNPWSYLKSVFTGNTRKHKELVESIEYLESWAENFWEETELGVKEIAHKFESQAQSGIKAELGIDLMALAGSAEQMKSITEEQKQQIVQRGQNIVSKAQIKDLSKVGTLLDSVIDDRQKVYWIVVDDLDGDWVEDKLRYKLIMTLMQISREFSRSSNVKTVICIRRDLIDRVFRFTRDSGFQEEKYSSLYLALNWSAQNLIKVLDKRINLLGMKKTGRNDIHIINVLPNKIDNINIKEYVTKITTRPRDVIALFNACITAAVDEEKLTQDAFKKAEGEYSRYRLRALADEWDATYPRLLDFKELFSRCPHSCKISTLNYDVFKEICLNRETARNDMGDDISMIAHDVVYEKRNIEYCLYDLVYVFFKTGFLGLKLQSHESEVWQDKDGAGVSNSEIDENTSIVIHKTFHRALGVN